MAVSISLSITQNSQNTTNNTSNVTVKVTAKWTNGSWNATGKCTGSITIDGTKYSFSGITFNTGQSTSGSKVIMTKTVNVSHNSNGTKTLACSASFVTGVSSGTVSCSGSKTLTTIPRKSSLSVANGTLGTKQTLTVTRESTSFTHTITAKCGSYTKTICTESTTTSFSFTPPLDWAKANTTGVSVTVVYTITTYNGDSIGSTSYTKTCAIPASVAPTCSISVTDPTGLADEFGDFLSGQSKYKVQVTPKTSYGSAIASCKVRISGTNLALTYASQSFTMGILKTTGTLKFTATVTDKRGRTGTATVNVEVQEYFSPIVTALSVHRCNEDGTANDQGEFVKVVFSARACQPSNNENSVSWVVGYKKTTEDQYTIVDLIDYENWYTVDNGEFIFPADSGSSYNVYIGGQDDISSGSLKTTTASTAFTIMHWLASGLGMAIGKIAELVGVLDIGFKTRFYGGILHPLIEPETDLNDVRTPNTYVGENVSTYNYGNCPLTTGTFTLEVVGMGEDGQVKQRLTYCHKTDARALERIYYGEAWGEWVCVSDFDGQLLWSGCYYMTSGHTITLAEAVSKQRSGIVLVFTQYVDGEATDESFHLQFVPKMQVSTHLGKAVCIPMCTSTLAYFGTKYLYINDDTIVGHDNNRLTGTGSCGIEYTNNRFVLRYVMGV